MKKLIFLISLCLLSQNCTIAGEIGESHYKGFVPVPKNEPDTVLRTQNINSNFIIEHSKAQEEVKEKPLKKSDLKFPGLKLPQETLATEETVQAQPVIQEKQTTFLVQTTPQVQQSVVTKQENQAPQVSQEVQVQQPTQLLEEADIQRPFKVKSYPQTKYTNTSETMYSQAVEPKVVETNTLENQAAQSSQVVPQQVTQSEYQPVAKTVEQSVQSAPQPAPQPVAIRLQKIEFPDSKVFSQQELQQLAAPLLAGPVTINDIQKVVADISRCYTLSNYPASKAYLPPQNVSNGVLKIGLLEGTIGKVNVSGNRWIKTSYFKKRIVNDKEGELLNIQQLEKDVIKFNNNNTSKVSVSLSAGENQGESDVTLNVTEQFPFRLSVMTDNQGRKSIGTGRFGSMLSADSILGISDRLSLGGYLGRGNRIGFTDYNVPVGHYGTRLGVSASASDISVVNGPMRQFDVGGSSQVYSVYVTQPVFDREGLNISSYSAANFKKSTSDILDYKFYDKSTFSLTQGFNLRKDTDRGIWYTGHYGSVGFKALSGDQDFFKYEGNITRLHDFGKGIVGQFRVSGQYSPDKDLPWMEQFQLGGMSTVRGYSEALLLGKSGYFASAEILTPLPILPKRIGSDKLGFIYPREMIKGAVFMDNGMIFPYKYGESIDSGELLMSWGFGLRVNLKSDLAARFYWGYGLHNKHEVDHRMGRFHFDITCAPDIGKLVDGRKPANKKDNKQKEDL